MGGEGADIFNLTVSAKSRYGFALKCRLCKNSCYSKYIIPILHYFVFYTKLHF